MALNRAAGVPTDGKADADGAIGEEMDVAALDLGPARDVAARHVAGGTLPCVAFGLVDAGGRTVSHVVPRPGRHLDADTVFFLASVSKAIVATTVMQVVEEERLDLHAPLARYVEELEPGGAGSVSAWHILTHTSGLPDIPVERLKRRQPGYAATLDPWPPVGRHSHREAATSTCQRPGSSSRRPWPASTVDPSRMCWHGGSPGRWA